MRCGSADPQASYPPFQVGARPTIFNGMPAVSEVHLRRLDRPERLHRRAVAVISINAPLQDVRRAPDPPALTPPACAAHRLLLINTVPVCQVLQIRTSKMLLLNAEQGYSGNLCLKSAWLSGFRCGGVVPSDGRIEG